MSKLVLNCGVIFLIFGFYLAGSSASQSFIAGATNKDFPGKCFYNDTQTPIDIGSTYKPTTECVQIKCREDYVLQLEFCPFYMVGEGCKVTTKEGAEFPECCAKITCPDKS